MKIRTASILFLFLVSADTAQQAFGAEHATAEGGHHGIPWLTLGFTFLNFIMFMAVLRRYVWPPIKQWVRERHELVVQELEAATRATREAQELRAQWQARIANLETELQQLRAQAQADIEREKERLLTAAREAAEGIRREAVKTAAEMTAQHWSAADQERAIGEFLQQVPA